MPINYNILQPQQVGSVISQLPSSENEDDLGSLLSGLTGLVGAFKGQGSPQTPSTAPAQYAQNAIGLNPVGNNTQSRLEQLTSDSNKGVFGNANALLGQSEFNPVLKNYLQKANPNLDPKVTPWCAGFVGSVLNASGLKGTGSLAAKSYLNYGTQVDKPSLGDIVVLNRTNNPELGHVGFYAGTDKKGNIQILGGNQDNSVSVKSFNANLVAGYRRPPSGQEIQSFAAQNNIKTPQQLSSVTDPRINKALNNIPRTTSTTNPAQMVAGPKQLKVAPPIVHAIKGSNKVYGDNSVMADVAAAQAILESRLDGNPSGLARNNNNYFGIKGKGTAGSVLMPTQEVIGGKRINTKGNFAANKSPEDSFNQHKQLMSNPKYKQVLEAKTVEEAAIALQKAGYATDPTYAKQLIQIYRKYVKPLKSQKVSMNDYGVPSNPPGIRFIPDGERDYEPQLQGNPQILQTNPNNGSSRQIYPEIFMHNQVNSPIAQLAMLGPNDPIPIYNEEGFEEIPTIPKQLYEDTYRSLDQGQDDYA